ncbi:hypothetical protein [Thermospira aquatica]|uniref:DUF4129 domain-containing protein n=1 Tax=Thermospira aquatica TaxID=2828656 RepID=A0AAX3BAF5_9SPIR|nr:hypothetical protein [Thermospira aquatica]URA09181.1 hypothetical protein KDW03_06630 [Thermospira aquatica]
MATLSWILMLLGFTITVMGSILSLFVSNITEIVPVIWISGIIQSIFTGFHIEQRRKLQTFVRLVLGFLLSLPAIIVVGNIGLIPRVPLSALIILLSVQETLMFLLWWGFSRKPQTFSHLLSDYPADNSLPYEKWAAEEIARLNLNTSLEGSEKLFFWLFFLSVFFSSIGSLVQPAIRNHLTVSWALLFLGFWGSWSSLHEQFQIFNWKMQGLSLNQTHKGFPKSLIMGGLLLSLGIAFLLPHRFVVFSLEKLGERFKMSVRQTEISLQTPEEFSPSPTNEISSSEATQERKPPSPVLRGALRILIILIGVYLVFGLIGYFFATFWSYKPKNRLIRWFIAFYEKNRLVFQIFGTLIRLFIMILFTITGISFIQQKLQKNKRKQQENEVLKQQLYALFENASATSDEKKEEIMTIVKYFVMLIETASSRILPYRHSYGPLEYIEKLTSNLPSLQESLFWIVGIFNESRYSLHILSQEKIRAFEETIQTVIGEINK